MTPRRSETAAPPPPVIGGPTLVFLVVASMIGSGVFTTSGHALESLPSPWLVLAAWFVAGVVALAGALSYGQLIRELPESGGEYVLLARRWHPAIGFVAGWTSLVAGFGGATAIAAVTLEVYVQSALQRDGIWSKGRLATAVVIAAMLSHGIRVRWGSWTQNAIVIAKLALLVAFFLVALTKLDWPGMLETPWWPERESLPSPIVAFASSLVWIAFSYSGFNAGIYIAEETRDPERTIPTALVAGTVVVWLLYLLANLTFVFAAPIDALRGRTDIAAVAAENLLGINASRGVRVIVALASLTSVLSLMMAGPRVTAKMAEDGWLPRWLGRGAEAPVYSILLQGAFAITLIHLTTFRELLAFLSLSLSLCSALAVLTLFSKGLSTPWPYRLAAAGYAGVTFVCGGLLAAAEPRQLLGVALNAALGLGVYGLMAARRPRKLPSH